jgi:hypothetical protein
VEVGDWRKGEWASHSPSRGSLLTISLVDGKDVEGAVVDHSRIDRLFEGFLYRSAKESESETGTYEVFAVNKFGLADDGVDRRVIAVIVLRSKPETGELTSLEVARHVIVLQKVDQRKVPPLQAPKVEDRQLRTYKAEGEKGRTLIQKSCADSISE